MFSVGTILKNVQSKVHVSLWTLGLFLSSHCAIEWVLGSVFILFTHKLNIDGETCTTKRVLFHPFCDVY